MQPFASDATDAVYPNMEVLDDRLMRPHRPASQMLFLVAKYELSRSIHGLACSVLCPARGVRVEVTETTETYLRVCIAKSEALIVGMTFRN